MAPATAGELIQGTIDHSDYLVNFPIDLFSTARVSLTAAFQGVRATHPTQYTKAVGAVSQLLDLAGKNYGLELGFLSSIPRGKGLASSTSEIAAALEAAANLLNYKLTAETSCLMNAKVEATDCVQATGVSLVHQLTGQILSSFPTPTGISVIIVDCGGSIATDEFDREKFHYVAKQNQAAHKEARQRLIRGLTANCAPMIGMAATISASINQKVIYKEQFPELLALAHSEGGLGVNCAHSGTVLGLMYDPLQVSEDNLFSKMQRIFGRANVFFPRRLISGGVHATSH
jgi:L-threonine kinase